MSYRHTPEMGEISGFGGGYEAICQDMLEAGVKWLNARITNPPANVYGLFDPEGKDAKALEAVVMKACNNDCTGAMFQAVMSRLFYIAANGWGNYCSEIIKRRNPEPVVETDEDWQYEEDETSSV